MPEPWIRYKPKNQGKLYKAESPALPYTEGLDPLVGLAETVDYLTTTPLRTGLNESLKASGPWNRFKAFGKGVVKSYANPNQTLTSEQVANKAGLSDRPLYEQNGRLSFGGLASKLSPAQIGGFLGETLLDPTNLVPGVAAGGMAFGSLKKVGKELGEDLAKKGIKNNLGRPVHPTAEGQENFKKWFEGSKVVDEKGQPLVVYRGASVDDTKDGNFPDLIRGFGVGYHSTDPKVAGRYALTTTPTISKDKIKELKQMPGYAPNISKSYIDIKKPLTEDYGLFDVFDVDEIIDDLKDFYNEFEYAEHWTTKEKKREILKILRESSPEFTGSSLGDDLKMIFGYIEDYAPEKMDDLKKKFDGVIYDDLEAGGKTIVPLISKTQIKSATGNSGKFDPKDPNILKGLAPVGPWMLYKRNREQNKKETVK